MRGVFLLCYHARSICGGGDAGRAVYARNVSDMKEGIVMAVLNSTILAKCWLQGSNNYQQRIPNPEIAGYAASQKALFDPMNNDLYNEFTGLLNGLIGTYIYIKQFENPLRDLKKPAIDYGNTERYVAVKYLKAHSGRVDDETLLKVEAPEYVEWFFSVGEPRRYEFSWSRQEMGQAFMVDGYGFDNLLVATISQMLSSANLDEMTIMVQQFANADAYSGGLYRYKLSGAPDDEATAKELLKAVRAVGKRMSFPTMLYNHIDVPVYESPDTLVLWVTPEVDASLDVDALAMFFNLDKADVQFRKIVIPEFPIPNVYAALTSEDFIYCRDFQTGLEPPFYNPGNRTTKYYYWQTLMIGANPAANCVLFTTDENTAVPTVEVSVTGLTLAPEAAQVPMGGEVRITATLDGTVTNDVTGAGIQVEPDAATYQVSAKRTGNDDVVTSVPLNSRTYVDNYGVLHVQKSGLEAGDVLTITAASVYINPSGATEVYAATADVTVTAAADGLPKGGIVEQKPYIVYDEDTEPATA